MNTTSVWGWSNFTSESAYMNRPLAYAFCTIWPASAAICAGSLVEPMTNSTGNPSPPGSGGGVRGMIRRPGILESAAAASI